MNIIKKIIKIGLNKFFNLFGLQIVNIDRSSNEFSKTIKILEYKYGHKKSKVSKTSIDFDENPIPWFTYPSIEYIKQLDLTNKVMLEWGAGSSSMFFSKRVKKVYSIEHNEEWYEKVKKYNIHNQEILFSEKEYSTIPKRLNVLFDIILIDGVERENCAKQVLSLINKGGLIILDNSDRHPDICSYFRESGYIEADFHGFGPINDYTWTTSLFFNRDIDLNPLTKQPLIPIGGGF